MGKKDDDLKSIYKDIRHRINKMYDKRREFFSHLVAFTFGMVVLWNVISPSQGWLTIAKGFSILWTMGLLIHFMEWIFEELKQRAIMRELRRVGLVTVEEPRMEKLKRSERLVRLSDDGELLDWDDDERWEPHRQRQ